MTVSTVLMYLMAMGWMRASCSPMNEGTYTSAAHQFYHGEMKPGQETIREIQRFTSDDTSAESHDYFEILYQDSKSLLLGARNALYNLSIDSFTENKDSRITWPPTGEDECLVTYKENCQNFMQIAVPQDDRRMTVCGTNAYKPRCREYQRNEAGQFDLIPGSDTDGVGLSSYSPTQPSVALVKDKRMYVATVANAYSRDDPLIYGQDSDQHKLRTVQYDHQVLNQPSFVHAFASDQHVNVLLQESAIEMMNCGKTQLPRIARVCSNDRGDRTSSWTSFFKARLNCSIPGDYPFYFTEIVSSTDLGYGHFRPAVSQEDRTRMFYAVFQTPQNSLHSSAICAFRYSDVDQVFRGPFKGQRDATSMWLPVSEKETPSPHPGWSCPENSEEIPTSTVHFIKMHPLMDRAVPAFGGRPVFLQASPKYRLTQIAVDFRVHAADGRYYDVIFIGTDDGRVLKTINKGMADGQIESVVIEDLKVFDDGYNVTGLRLLDLKLIVLSIKEVKAIPIHRCHRAHSCSDCVALQDPYCSWDGNVCRHSRTGIQSIENGRDSRCPIIAKVLPTEPPTTTTTTTTICAPCPTCTSVPETVVVTQGPIKPLQTVVFPVESAPDFRELEERDSRTKDYVPPPEVSPVMDSSQGSYSSKAIVMAVILSVAVTCVIFILLVVAFVYIRHRTSHRRGSDKTRHGSTPPMNIRQLASSPSSYSTSNIYQVPPTQRPQEANGGLQRQQSLPAPRIERQQSGTSTLERKKAHYVAPPKVEGKQLVTEYKDRTRHGSSYSNKYPIHVEPAAVPGQSNFQQLC